FFPRYDAVFLYRLELALRAPRAVRALERLGGRIDEARMAQANGAVSIDKQPSMSAAHTLVEGALGQPLRAEHPGSGGTGSWLARAGAHHPVLVAFSLAFAVLVGIPLGVF